MTPSDYISIAALSLAVFALGWNIYRDVLQKPKFDVWLSVYQGFHNDGTKLPDEHISLRAVNIGPIRNKASIVTTATHSPLHWLRKKKFKSMGVMFLARNHPLCNQAAKNNELVEVGDEAAFAFPYTADCFLADDFELVGICDGFGKYHWCSKKNIREIKDRYLKDFEEK